MSWKPLHLHNIPVGQVETRSVAGHEVWISCPFDSMTIWMNWWKLPTTSIRLFTCALPRDQINFILKHAAWRHRGVGQPNLAVKRHVHIGVQTDGIKLDYISFLLCSSKVEYLQELMWKGKKKIRRCGYFEQLSNFYFQQLILNLHENFSTLHLQIA